MHNFEIAKGFNDTTVMFCRSCGLSYRLCTYHRDTADQPARAVWELMTAETPSGEAISVAPCRVESVIAGGSRE